MKVLILGDCHGEWGELNIVMARALRKHHDITAFVQVGDFGYAWPGSKPFKLLPTFWEDADMEHASALPFYWLDGNHENHDQLEKDQGAYQSNMIYKHRGSINTFHTGDGVAPARRAMFFGGASSIDKEQRTEGASWWPQESIKYSQVMYALAQSGPLDMIFSHEHPTAFPYGSYKGVFGKGDKDALDAVRHHFKPRFWIFGHHHGHKTGIIDGTEWACAPIIDSRQAILWDGDSIQLLDLNLGKSNYHK